MKKGILIALGAAGLAMAACKKDKNDDGKKTTAVELLTSATWKFDTATIDVTGDGVPDSGLPDGFLENCERDNTITFKSDKTGVVDEGATKCDPSDPQTSPFNWSLNSDNTILTISGSDAFIAGAVKIKQLTSSNLVITKDTTVNIGLEMNATIIVTLKK